MSKKGSNPPPPAGIERPKPPPPPPKKMSETCIFCTSKMKVMLDQDREIETLKQQIKKLQGAQKES